MRRPRPKPNSHVLGACHRLWTFASDNTGGSGRNLPVTVILRRPRVTRRSLQLAHSCAGLEGWRPGVAASRFSAWAVAHRSRVYPRSDHYVRKSAKADLRWLARPKEAGQAPQGDGYEALVVAFFFDIAGPIFSIGYKKSAAVPTEMNSQGGFSMSPAKIAAAVSFAAVVSC